jgi:hypothetical protein
MPKVVFLVGLSGAGKSRKAEEMEKNQGYVWVEGIHGNLKEFLKLVDSLRAGKDCVAEEFQTITAGYRAWIKDWLEKGIPGVTVEFLFFEKDIVKLTRNVLSRPDGETRIEDHLHINMNNFHVYDIPTNPPAVILQIDPPTTYKAKP